MTKRAKPKPKPKVTLRKRNVGQPKQLGQAVDAVVAEIKRGRPTEYRPEMIKQAEKLCALGATDVELADFFEVHVATLYRWKAEHPEFCEAIRISKSEADNRVERSLYHRACGYSHESVKIFMPAGALEPVYAPFREHFPPDTTAAIFWLKNRRPDQWREKVDHQVGGVNGGPVIYEVRWKEPGESNVPHP